jgi:hypothetical protein
VLRPVKPLQPADDLRVKRGSMTSRNLPQIKTSATIEVNQGELMSAGGGVLTQRLYARF